MAYYKFTKAILNGDHIDVYNNGDMKRDFTFIDDIVEGVIRVMDKIPTPNKNKYSTAKPPYRIYNIGNNNPVSLRDFITAIEKACGVKANENHMPMQAGDVPVTFANIDDLIADIKFNPSTSISTGISEFVKWFKERQ
jgi:UDP-glucuronate 4-epimerase